MTPLAHRIAKECTLPLKDRSFKDPVRLIESMDDVHCFDVSDVIDVAEDLARTMLDRGRTAGALAFLPAPKTWIEWRANDGSREGVLLELISEGLATAKWAHSSNGLFLSSRNIGLLELQTDGAANCDHFVLRDLESQSSDEAAMYVVVMYAILAMINTPRVIGRRQHMPHAGLQRKMAAARGMVGKFPMHAWTEIVLEVTPPQSEEGEPKQAYLSGVRALHFCRCHLRIRCGRLELVSAHWRGDPALGIKQSRYKLAKPRRAA